ncbi:protein-tyrosine phosphatase-like protein [Lasiosphaeria miniovina]|uniref:Protein-tyrosine phosphatase-like protein n=1 Tax=Lasiosphaeria miniovina TaxID=1954250 RepID=A0AA40B6L2_9PEZI|nr:protein-tyrosine phosphatase-like protein [Lasiosphaeria miniovina]KAK0728637.1 protein-tyrosine phosphatase-like protein [Lasiosphaeria miniovina]
MAATSPADLAALAATDVAVPIPKAQLYAALQSPPFAYVPGTFNTRDIGRQQQQQQNAQTTSDGNSSSVDGIRPGYAFRSGGFLLGPGLSDDAKAVLTRRLGITKIFDFRSVEEHTAQPDPSVPGIENVWTPAVELEAVVEVRDFVDGGGEKGYEAMYLDVLRLYGANLKVLLEHVRDEPAKGFLFHCTAGRDRTGVVAGLLMALAGAAADDIAHDYLLSRIGTEPAREQLIAFALKGSGAAGPDAPGFHNLISLRGACWAAFVAAVDREYGGFEGYVRHTLGFSAEDVAVIKKNLVEG